DLTGDDATAVEASWYGDHPRQVPLGADFHSRRLKLVASQDKQVAQEHRHRGTVEQRRRAGLQAVADERFAGLITGVSPWGELPKIMDLVATPGQFSDDTVCHVVEYPNTIEGVLHV